MNPSPVWCEDTLVCPLFDSKRLTWRGRTGKGETKGVSGPQGASSGGIPPQTSGRHASPSHMRAHANGPVCVLVTPQARRGGGQTLALETQKKGGGLLRL